jgi:hypothetical protein
MSPEANKELLARKMELENKWNNKYLVEGRVTVDMKPIEEEIRRVRKKMVMADVEVCRLAHKDYNAEQNKLVSNS